MQERCHAFYFSNRTVELGTELIALGNQGVTSTNQYSLTTNDKDLHFFAQRLVADRALHVA